MGEDQPTGPVDQAWAGAVPAAIAPPRRPPIVLEGDQALVRVTVRAALRLSLLSRQGLALAVLAVVFGYAVIAATGTSTWWRVGVAAVGLYLLEVLVVARDLWRSMRRLLLTGHAVRSWYAAPDVLALETGTGRTDLRPGSLLSARRRGSVTSVRLRRNRRLGFLPSGLLTDDDLAFLLAPAVPVTPAAAASATADLPLLLVVTDRTRRDLRRAVVTWTARRPQMAFLLGCAGLLLAIGSASHVWAQTLVALVLLSFWGLRVVGSARLFARSYLPGSLVRAGLVGDRLRLQTGDDLVDDLSLRSVRRCHVGRRHVRLDLGGGRPSLFVPRDLFPPTELAELQRRVAGR
ncbi:hypothetical protein GCM10027517_05330 [Phycicoccus ginsengisoli]